MNAAGEIKSNIKNRLWNHVRYEGRASVANPNVVPSFLHQQTAHFNTGEMCPIADIRCKTEF